MFLINGLPSPVLDNKSPFELLHFKASDYSMLRSFGCLCYQSTSPHQRHKFQPRSKVCVFLGYPAGYKGYKLLDLETNAISISRHVFFFEMLFPSGTADSAVDDIFDEPAENIGVVKSPDNIDKDVVVQKPPGIINTDIAESSKRKRKQPEHLQDYYCNTLADERYPIFAYINLTRLSDEHQAFIGTIDKYPEPQSYTQEKKLKIWNDSTEVEEIALESTGTWIICSLPPGKTPIGCRWVFKVKLNADGTVEHFKTRLVAKGYTHREGLDFVDSFSPVAKMTTVRTLLSVSAAKNWSLHPLDIFNAFLNGDLDEEIYMTLPPRYAARKGETFPPNVVLKLQKSIYGLKQASRKWFLKFSSTLVGLGFRKSHSHQALFTRMTGDVYVALLVYDDIVIASNNDEAVDQLKKDLSAAFKLRDLGPLKYFLGLEIARSQKGISVCQRRYVLELLEETGFIGCRPSSIPMEPSIKLALHNVHDDNTS